jgi:hypothetical protein
VPLIGEDWTCTATPDDGDDLGSVDTDSVSIASGSGAGTVDFANVSLAAAEVARCLKPGGCWVVSTQTPKQHVEGFW